MGWAWIHPFLRKNHVLKDGWADLNMKFGDFAVSGPLSPAMKNFLFNFAVN